MNSRGLSRKQYSAEFKYKVAIAALCEQKTQAEICAEFGVALTQIQQWKKQLQEEGASVFERGRTKKEDSSTEIEKLHATIGKLKVENDFLEKVLNKCR